MKIEILESGCVSCRTMEKNVLEALASLNKLAEVEVVDDIQKIMEYGVMRTPALVIDGKVVSVGKNLSSDEIVKLIS